jgi:hypothetical protein
VLLPTPGALSPVIFFSLAAFFLSPSRPPPVSRLEVAGLVWLNGTKEHRVAISQRALGLFCDMSKAHKAGREKKD